MAENKDRTCSVCLEQFREPKILPCCHTFCLKCLEKVTREKAEITCPQCRKTHAIPAGGLQDFLTDFIVSHEVEVSGVKAHTGPLAKEAPACGECEVEGPVESYCRDCQAYLCRECSTQAHKKFKSYRSHKVIPLQDLDAATLQSFQVHYCSTHDSEVLKLYCETCGALICRDCTLVDHRQHNYMFVQDARKQINDQLTCLEKDCRKKFAAFKANLGEIQRVETTAANHPEALKTKINVFFNDVIQSIEKQRQQLLTQAEAECQKDLKLIWADKDFHQTTLCQISAALGLVNKARKCTSDIEMILTALQSIKQLSRLKGIKWDASAFTAVVGSSAKFLEGTKPEAGKMGYIERDVCEWVVRNLPATAALGETVTFQVGPTLVAKRSQQTLNLQEAVVNVSKTNVVVKYGQSKKLLNTVSVSQSSQFKGGLVVTVRLVCGGEHTIEIEFDGKPVSGSPYSFNVTGSPEIGARVRPGPDWKRNECSLQRARGKKSKRMKGKSVMVRERPDINDKVEGTVQHTPVNRYPYGMERNVYEYDRYQYNEFEEYEDQVTAATTTVNVYWDDGYSDNHSWGGPYEIELV